MNLKGNWNYPTLIRFGAGRIRELPDACRTLGMQRPLIVTDPGLTQLPMIGNALSILSSAGLGAAVFCDIQANPVEANVTQGVAAFRSGSHDGVVAFGGGGARDGGQSDV